MMQFNILGKGFLDIEAPQGIGFKQKNPWFCFCDVELGRSTEFTIPATNHNRLLLGFGEDPAEYGDQLRMKHDCQMVYDGGLKNGTLTVTAYEGDVFKCVYVTDNAPWIDRLQGMKLSEVPIGNHSVVWDTGTTVYAANSVTPSPSDFVKIVKYDNGGVSGSWQLVPSVHVFNFVHALLTALDVPYGTLTVQPNNKHWLVAGSLKNGATDSVTLTHTNTTSASISQSMGLLSTTTEDLEWAKGLYYGAYIGGGNVTAEMFKAEQDLKMTFGIVPADVYLIKWNKKLKQCKCLGGYPSGSYPEWVTTPLAMLGDVGKDLSGQSIQFYKGDCFFFSDYFGNIITNDYFFYPEIFTDEGYFGWKDVLHPFSINATLSIDDELILGETWWLRYNMPDMTVFDFLKSVALSSAKELTVTPSDFMLFDGFYGEYLGNQYFKPLDKVISIDRVERKAWGGARHDIVKFESEDYVTEPIVTDYETPNANLGDTAQHLIKFSEGAVSDNGVLIKDATADSGGTVKFAAKKWTLAMVDTTAAHPDYLQRVDAPVAVGYDDIAGNSTCVMMKAVMTFADFIALQPMTVLVFRGMAYVWTDVSWSQDVATLTLQRVSALIPAAPVVLTGIDAVFTPPAFPDYYFVGTDSLADLKPYLVVTATYSDGTSRVLADNEYTLTGSLVYPSATITVDFEGETDTFTVAVAFDAEVEYLESTGTQYIDTLIEPHQDITFEIKWKNASTQIAKYLFGSGTTSSNCIRGYIDTSGNWRFGHGYLGYDFTGTNINVVTMDKNRMVINGTPYSYAGTVGTFSSNRTIKLFASGYLLDAISTRMYYVNIYDNGDDARIFFPVRAGGVGYMFDQVTGQLFGNDGTGDFVIGPDV